MKTIKLLCLVSLIAISGCSHMIAKPICYAKATNINGGYDIPVIAIKDSPNGLLVQLGGPYQLQWANAREVDLSKCELNIK